MRICLLLSPSQLGYFQTWLLYHNALSSGVEINDILRYARKSKERASAEDSDTIADLRKQVSEQQKLIQHIIGSSKGSGGGALEMTERSSLFPGAKHGYGAMAAQGSAFESPRITSVSEHVAKSAADGAVGKAAGQPVRGITPPSFITPNLSILNHGNRMIVSLSISR